MRSLRMLLHRIASCAGKALPDRVCAVASEIGFPEKSVCVRLPVLTMCVCLCIHTVLQSIETSHDCGLQGFAFGFRVYGMLLAASQNQSAFPSPRPLLDLNRNSKGIHKYTNIHARTHIDVHTLHTYILTYIHTCRKHQSKENQASAPRPPPAAEPCAGIRPWFLGFCADGLIGV